MAGKVKLSKRQIKEDQFTTFMLTAKDRLSENWQPIALGVVGLIAVVALISWYFNSQTAQVGEASEQFANAMRDYSSERYQPALLGFQQIMDNYGGTSEARRAAFLTGRIHLNAREYSEAITFFQKFLREAKKDPMNRAAALGGIAACYEDQANLTEAASYYMQAADEYVDGPAEPDYRFSAVRCLIGAGDLAGSGPQVDILKERFAGTEQANRAIVLYTEKSGGK
ncbi:MAG: tetratricopeptide repeat protein [candidate division Zixibacteria bacterium]|nr:tetratricopeptide repeat protein [candidate division Zixibacteria bacterium]